MPINPKNIKKLYFRGRENIAADVGLGEPYVPIFIRCHFAGGTGTADMTIGVNSAAGSEYDMTLHTATARGINADLNLRIPEDEAPGWVMGYGEGEEFDQLNIAWTNPDSGTLEWAMTIGVIPTRLWDA